jgi:1-deoxy-D-xylulose-5-phosphate reductoisomerase
MEQKNIALLGATGSIGISAQKVFRQHPGKFRVVSAAAGKQWDKLLPIIKEFKIEKACLWDPAAASELKRHWNGKVLTGMDGLLELAADPEADYVLNGLVGAIGCKPTLEAIARGKHVGLANKETMVMAGAVINEALRKNPASRIIPIDSEHSAIFQCLAGRPVSEVENIELTASGGPFREWPKSRFSSIRKSDALKHPTWKMGEKITIDSATLMNKGLEVIEAHFLFDVPFESIKVVVHPTSIVHSFVQFRDGSLMAQLGCPDMQLPIQYALTYPERWPLKVDRLDMTKIAKLEFFAPDFDKFPCLALAYKAGSLGGTAPAIVNAANEVAVARFLDEEIAFMDIPAVIAEVLDIAEVDPHPGLEQVIKADAWARGAAADCIAGLADLGPAKAGRVKSPQEG